MLMCEVGWVVERVASCIKRHLPPLEYKPPKSGVTASTLNYRGLVASDQKSSELYMHPKLLKHIDRGIRYREKIIV